MKNSHQVVFLHAVEDFGSIGVPSKSTDINIENHKRKDHLVEDATEVEEEADDTVVVGPEASA